MQFSCAQCSTRYAVPDDKVRGKRIRTKCRKCGAEIVVDGSSLVEAVPQSGAPAPKPVVAPRATPHAGTASPARVEEPWTVAISRTDQRKMVTAEVVDAYAAGTITDSTLVWKQGMDRWQPPFEIPAIALALLSRGLEPKPRAPDQKAKTEPPPPGASAASDWDDEATRVFDAAVVAEDFAPKFPPPKAPVIPPPKVPVIAPPKAPVITAPKAPVIPPPKVPVITPPKAPTPSAAARKVPEPSAPTSAPKSADAGIADWDDEDEATKMLAPDRSLLAARLPKAQPGPKPAAKASHAPPVPPRRSATPRPSPAVAPIVPPPAPLPGPLAPTPTKAIEATSEKAGPTARPPPGAPVEDPFAFEDEATAVITADRARALLEEQLEKPPTAQANETPLSFGTDTESPKAPPAPPEAEGAEGSASPRAKRDSTRHDDLVEQGPTIVVAESEKRTSSAPPPPAKSPVPPPPPAPAPAPAGRSRDMSGIQHERTRVVRARKKPGGPMFWVALIVALAGAAGAGYYASRLLESPHAPSPERR